MQPSCLREKLFSPAETQDGHLTCFYVLISF